MHCIQLFYKTNATQFIIAPNVASFRHDYSTSCWSLISASYFYNPKSLQPFFFFFYVFLPCNLINPVHRHTSLCRTINYNHSLCYLSFRLLHSSSPLRTAAIFCFCFGHLRLGITSKFNCTPSITHTPPQLPFAYLCVFPMSEKRRKMDAERLD